MNLSQNLDLTLKQTLPSLSQFSELIDLNWIEDCLDQTGKEADAWLGSAHITVNKNAVPNDPRSPFVTSGIRIGTPAVTTRGFGEAEVRELAGWIADILDSKGDEAVINAVKAKVEAVCAKFPVYAN